MSWTVFVQEPDGEWAPSRTFETFEAATVEHAVQIDAGRHCRVMETRQDGYPRPREPELCSKR